jgi:hypothetical protein
MRPTRTLNRHPIQTMQLGAAPSGFNISRGVGVSGMGGAGEEGGAAEVGFFVEC